MTHLICFDLLKHRPFASDSARAGCGKTLPSSFESLRMKGAVVEFTEVLRLCRAC